MDRIVVESYVDGLVKSFERKAPRRHRVSMPSANRWRIKRAG
jgi:hypothetical protein